MLTKDDITTVETAIEALYREYESAETEDEKYVYGSLYTWLKELHGDERRELFLPAQVITHPYAFDKDGNFDYGKCDITVIECPNCGSRSKIYDKHKKKNKFCGNCGQALDWEDDLFYYDYENYENPKLVCTYDSMWTKK